MTVSIRQLYSGCEVFAVANFQRPARALNFRNLILRAASASPDKRKMPYTSADALPPTADDHPHDHAQDIFLSASNHACGGYWDQPDREATAFKAGWAALRHRYLNSCAHWVEK